jgi:hypothetical protein
VREIMESCREVVVQEVSEVKVLEVKVSEVKVSVDVPVDFPVNKVLDSKEDLEMETAIQPIWPAFWESVLLVVTLSMPKRKFRNFDKVPTNDFLLIRGAQACSI